MNATILGVERNNTVYMPVLPFVSKVKLADWKALPWTNTGFHHTAWFMNFNISFRAFSLARSSASFSMCIRIFCPDIALRRTFGSSSSEDESNDKLIPFSLLFFCLFFPSFFSSPLRRCFFLRSPFLLSSFFRRSLFLLFL
uniref:Uncharacterized protein n=1 Tax=Trieres chinensis TaxID=1514140 RepID=A0A7S1ZY88_TRICV